MDPSAEHDPVLDSACTRHTLGSKLMGQSSLAICRACARGHSNIAAHLLASPADKALRFPLELSYLVLSSCPELLQPARSVAGHFRLIELLVLVLICVVDLVPSRILAAFVIDVVTIGVLSCV